MNRGTIALYYKTDILSPASHVFAPALKARLEQALRRAGWAPETWVEKGGGDGRLEAWQELRDALDERRIQGVIFPAAGMPSSEVVAQVKAPWSAFTQLDVRQGVDTDYNEFLRLAVQSLSAEGCRSLGLICAFNFTLPSLPLRSGHAISSALVRILTEKGLHMHPFWIKLPESVDGPDAEHRFGKESFLEIWQQPNRPDGLILITDVCAAGVFEAIEEAGVRVPDQIRLAFLANSDVAMKCPFRATAVEFDTAKIAEALVAQLECQVRGDCPQRVFIVPSIRRV